MNSASIETAFSSHPVVSKDHWVAERKTLLAREKELKRLQDVVAQERRALPWVRIEKNYVFDGTDGRRSLAELFEGRSQLMVQHFMFPPDWEQGCASCSFMADHIDGMNVHLAHRDVTLLVVSRTSLADIEGFRRRMGWRFKHPGAAASARWTTRWSGCATTTDTILHPPAARPRRPLRAQRARAWSLRLLRL